MPLSNGDIETQFCRGMAAGQAWADLSLFTTASDAPFSADLDDSPYNVGVLHGIVAELQRCADELLKRADAIAEEERLPS